MEQKPLGEYGLKKRNFALVCRKSAALCLCKSDAETDWRFARTGAGKYMQAISVGNKFQDFGGEEGKNLMSFHKYTSLKCNLKKLFIFWLCWVFIAVWALLQLRPAGATLQLRCPGLLQWLLLLLRMGSRVCSLPQLWHEVSVVEAQA